MKAKKTWLVIDSHYLAWRSFHGIRNLSTTLNLRTEVLYGFLRDIISFQDIHNTKRVIFCFDKGVKERKKIDPRYKANRRKKIESLSKEEKENRKHCVSQIRMLRKSILSEIGFQNVFFQKGYEADDIIASVCRTIRKRDEKAIIIGADNDLLQLLNKNVLLWNPNTKEVTTHQSFQDTYSILPKEWAWVKAIAGDAGDNVIGVQGVGEMTALRYIREELPESSKAHRNIMDNHATVLRNLKLVKLPMKGVGSFDIIDDRLSRDNWNVVMHKLEMNSLIDKVF